MARACLLLTLVSALAVLVALALPRLAWADTARIYAGVYLHDVSRFDLKDGTFDVDAELWAKWSGEMDPEQIRLANATDELERELLGHESDGDWHAARWRLRGTMRGEFPVYRFPLDEQRLSIVLELPATDGELVPDLAGSGVSPRFSVTDWEHDSEFRPTRSIKAFPSDLGQLAFEGRPAEMHRVSFDVTLRRPLGPVLLKLFLPLAIVGLVVFASLFVGPEMLQPRMTMCVTGLVACFAFQFSISDVLPVVAYLTLADVVFIVVYGIAIACVVGAVLGYALHVRGRPTAAARVSRTLQFVVPVAVATTLWGAVPPPYPPPEVEVQPLPSFEPPASAREVVRMGTTSRLRLASLPPGVGSGWNLVHDDALLGLLPIGVERIPGIDNDALRFLPAGGLEVTWRIREGARWSDGTPLTADDLLLALEASPDPEIDAVTRVDARTVTLRWTARLARALDAPLAWPRHVVADVLAAEGYEAARRYLAENPVPGLGPLRWVSVDEDRAVAEANPHYPGPAPALSRFEVIRYADMEALVDAFLRREIDLTLPAPLDDEAMARVERERAGSVHRTPSANLLLLQPNLSHPTLGRAEVRRALLRAIDRESLAYTLAGEGGRVAHAPAGDPGATERWTEKYDPERARAELAQAGADGEALTLTHAETVDPDVLAQLVRDLEAAGVSVVLEPVQSTWPNWRMGGHEGLLLHQLRVSPDQALRQWWGLPLVDGRYPDDARNGAYSEAVHALVQREERALYPERRLQLRDAIHGAWMEHLPGLPLALGDERVLADPALRGWERPLERPFGLGVERWYFAAP